MDRQTNKFIDREMDGQIEKQMDRWRTLWRYREVYGEIEQMD